MINVDIKWNSEIIWWVSDTNSLVFLDIFFWAICLGKISLESRGFFTSGREGRFNPIGVPHQEPEHPRQVTLNVMERISCFRCQIHQYMKGLSRFRTWLLVWGFGGVIRVHNAGRQWCSVRNQYCAVCPVLTTPNPMRQSCECQSDAPWSHQDCPTI